MEDEVTLTDPTVVSALASCSRSRTGNASRAARRSRAASLKARLLSSIAEESRRAVSAELHRASKESIAGAPLNPDGTSGTGALVTTSLRSSNGRVRMRAQAMFKNKRRVGTLYAVSCGGSAWVFKSEQRGGYAKMMIAAGIIPTEP